MRIETERLILREWRDPDRDAYAAIVGDPAVRRFYPTVLDRAGADAQMDRFIASIAQDGVSYLAVERRSDGALLGHVGLTRIAQNVSAAVKGHPEFDLGWTIGREYWGEGYAPEAARAIIDHAFARRRLPEVVALTATLNLASQRVMQKLGMSSDPADDFDHPNVPAGHPLRRHVLYRMANPGTLRAS